MSPVTCHLSPVGEDVLKIYTLNYELSDCAAREDNPPVNSGKLSSVNGPGAGGGQLSTAPRASRDRSVSSWTLGEEVTGVSLLTLHPAVPDPAWAFSVAPVSPSNQPIGNDLT